jgi:hypothetical protein
VKRTLASGKTHYRRLRNSIAAATGIISLSLLIGMLGYHYTAHLSWMDSFLNAAMILTGMGPVDRMPDDASKLFSALYAIFGGVVFLSSIALILSPLIHRVFHRFNIEDE